MSEIGENIPVESPFLSSIGFNFNFSHTLLYLMPSSSTDSQISSFRTVLLSSFFCVLPSVSPHSLSLPLFPLFLLTPLPLQLGHSWHLVCSQVTFHPLALFHFLTLLSKLSLDIPLHGFMLSAVHVVCPGLSPSIFLTLYWFFLYTFSIMT